MQHNDLYIYIAAHPQPRRAVSCTRICLEDIVRAVSYFLTSVYLRYITPGTRLCAVFVEAGARRSLLGAGSPKPSDAHLVLCQVTPASRSRFQTPPSPRALSHAAVVCPPSCPPSVPFPCSPRRRGVVAYDDDACDDLAVLFASLLHLPSFLPPTHANSSPHPPAAASSASTSSCALHPRVASHLHRCYPSPSSLSSPPVSCFYLSFFSSSLSSLPFSILLSSLAFVLASSLPLLSSSLSSPPINTHTGPLPAVITPALFQPYPPRRTSGPSPPRCARTACSGRRWRSIITSLSCVVFRVLPIPSFPCLWVLPFSPSFLPSAALHARALAGTEAVLLRARGVFIVARAGRRYHARPFFLIAPVCVVLVPARARRAHRGGCAPSSSRRMSVLVIAANARRPHHARCGSSSSRRARELLFLIAHTRSCGHRGLCLRTHGVLGPVRIARIASSPGADADAVRLPGDICASWAYRWRHGGDIWAPAALEQEREREEDAIVVLVVLLVLLEGVARGGVGRRERVLVLLLVLVRETHPERARSERAGGARGGLGRRRLVLALAVLVRCRAIGAIDTREVLMMVWGRASCSPRSSSSIAAGRSARGDETARADETARVLEALGVLGYWRDRHAGGARGSLGRRQLVLALAVLVRCWAIGAIDMREALVTLELHFMAVLLLPT
ncbi:hypothetical protein B0H10DRAFT_2229699 [Mycena sp. CBHHK59/15]|nr:hypothetical protein B0H10DRAFT_2229699 [Mycena sp. CBHHK59/15]